MKRRRRETVRIRVARKMLRKLHIGAYIRWAPTVHRRDLSATSLTGLTCSETASVEGVGHPVPTIGPHW